MEFSIKCNQLAKPLSAVIGVVEKRQTLPILSNVLLSLTDDGQQLAITGTDLEVELVGQCQLDTAATKTGKITVPGRKLVDICRSLPDDAELKFQHDGQRAIIKSGRSRFTLSTLPAEEFPNLEEHAEDISFAIPQTSINFLAQRTHFAMAQQDVRYYLNGMLFELSEGSIRTVATDGHRLAFNSIDAPVIDNKSIQVIVPRKGITELMRLVEDSDQALDIAISNNHIRVHGTGFIFTSKLIDGTFPDYDRVIPKGGNKSIIINRDELKQALSRVAILCNEKFRGVRLQLRPGQATILANNPDQEEAEEVLALDYEAEDLDIGFNVNYLLDILNTVNAEQVKLTFTDAKHGVLVEEQGNDSGSLFVIMPMQL